MPLGSEEELANGGITVAADAILPVALVFDLDALLGSLDFSSAEIEGGTITIDETHNKGLLDVFESKLAKSVDLDEQDD